MSDLDKLVNDTAAGLAAKGMITSAERTPDGYALSVTDPKTGNVRKFTVHKRSNPHIIVQFIAALFRRFT